MSRVLLVHPGTGSFVQQAARGLYESGLLTAYVTTFAYQSASLSAQALQFALRALSKDPERLLLRRRVTEVPESLVITHPLPEYLRLLAKQARLNPIMVDRVWERTELWFDRIVARRHVRAGQAVYGYEHAALRTFERQKELGGLCIYEMPTCHHGTLSEILASEYARFPDLETPYWQHLRRLAPRRNVRKDAELALADLVVVNSSFSRESIRRAGVPEERILTVPLGAPLVAFRQKDTARPFAFLSAGSQSVRKGTHYLLEAWRMLAPDSRAELWLVGHMDLPERLLAALPGTVRVYPPVSPVRLSELYARAGALVFSALAEGFGMVITEAMAHGLPVITTEHSAGADLIRHGENGFLVPVRDAEQLAQTMAWCLDHQEAACEVGRRAAATASLWQWSDYRAALGAAVRAFLVTGRAPTFQWRPDAIGMKP